MQDKHGQKIVNRDEMLSEIIIRLSDLQATYMSLEEFNTAVLAGSLAAKPGLTVDDRHFEEQNPEHPLAAANRFARIKAADRIMNLTQLYGKPLPADILEILHRSLFDCSAAVRHSIAGALFMAGDESSIEYLTNLLEQEQDSPAVRIRAQATLVKISSPFTLPENIPQIIVVLDNLLLVEELMETTWREGAALRHARPDSPDIIAFSGHVKIIDRQLLGKSAWKDFCDYLAEVNNDQTDYPILDENGELVIELPTRDDTPLIIVDNEPAGSTSGFSRPITRGPIYKVPAWNSEAICCIVKECIQMEMPIAMVRAVERGN